MPMLDISMNVVSAVVITVLKPVCLGINRQIGALPIVAPVSANMNVDQNRAGSVAHHRRHPDATYRHSDNRRLQHFGDGGHGGIITP